MTVTKENVREFIKFSSEKRIFDTGDYVSKFGSSIREMLEAAQSKGHVIKPCLKSGPMARGNEFVFKYYGAYGKDKYGMFILDEVSRSDDLVHVLVDVNNVLFRMFFATKGSLSTTISHFKGVLNKVVETVKMRDNCKKCNIILMHDGKNSFRKKIYPKYKEGRHEGVDIDWDTLNRARKMIQSWKKYRQYMLDGFESDDLIAAYIHRLTTLRLGGGRKNKKDLIIILSNDKDFYQLIRRIKGCEVLIARPGKIWNYIAFNDIIKDYGITPDLFGDVKSIMGDNSDNIRGLDGIGEKRALKLIQGLGSLDKWCFKDNFSDGERKHIRNIVEDNGLRKYFEVCRSREGKKILRRNRILMDLNNVEILNRIDFSKNKIKRKDRM